MADFLPFIPLLLQGFALTVQAAVYAAFLGLLVGAVLALCSFGARGVRWPVLIFISVVRGVPDLLIILAFYYGLGALLAGQGDPFVDLGPLLCGIAALALIFGCYVAEALRGAALSIPSGEIEAAIAAGFSRRLLVRRINAPQAFVRGLPALGNLLQVLIKDTALLSVIGVLELMNQSKSAIRITGLPFTFFAAAACLYMLLTVLAGWGRNALEKNYGKGILS
jgi:putative lysine/arginine/ornithine/histidine/octopine transport system permease protein